MSNAIVIMRRVAAASALLLAGGPALASDGLDGAHMSLLWALPFAGILLSIALGPLVAARWWHPHYGKAAGAWAIAAIAPMALVYGAPVTGEAIFHALALEYLPFIVMLFALFTTAGGLLVRGGATGSALSNVTVLALGAALAN